MAFYLKDHEVSIYDYTNRSVTMHQFQCMRFSFASNKWETEFTSRPIEITMRSLSLRWNVCYDPHLDAFYFLSNKHHLLRYDRKGQEWTLLIDGVEKGQRVTSMFVIWTSEIRAGVICGIEEGMGVATFKQIDVNEIEKGMDAQWKPYLEEYPEIEQILSSLWLDQ